MSIFNGTADDIFNKKTDYPLGSVCMFKTNIDPNEMYGGTWVRIKGKFILGADDDTYPLGSEGGEATHTLTESELASHIHQIISEAGAKTHLVATEGSGTDGPGYSFNDSSTDQDQNISGAFYATATGGDQPHNNMPPYLANYCWRRIA